MKNIKHFCFAFLLLFVMVKAKGQIGMLKEDVKEKLKNVDRQFFIENKGQWPSEVLYLTQMGGLNTWITTNGMLYEFYKTEELKDESTILDAMQDKFEHAAYKRWGHRVSYKLIGNNAVVNTQGKHQQIGYNNYLIGNDPSKHASNVGLYKEALVKDVYTGIDMRYYFDKGLLRYDYMVHPGADPSQIQFSIEGSERTYLNKQGELIFTTCFGEVKNADLYSYQSEDKKQVEAKFIKQGENWTIALGNYNKNEILIIDPLIYSTYIGGTGDEYGNSITLDASGNAYITGYTNSTNYDITTGVFQTTFAGNQDVFVTKLNATGTALIYSTYIGGSGEDVGNSITVDASNNTYITGYTSSTNFDITGEAYQTTNAGSYDVFVSKLNTTGTALIYSTYIGGTVSDEGFDIALDASNNAYISGASNSANYDVTSGAFQTTNAGIGLMDIFVTKLNASGSALIYSTYIGGSADEYGVSIALDASNNAYITGYTWSTNYDITSGVFQTTKDVNNDAFVTKLNTTGTALLYSTYIGGNGQDFGASIVLDASNNVYITGSTTSTNYDVTSGAFQTTNAGLSDAFVTKLNTTGTALLYSTYIGGTGNDDTRSIALDAFGNACITGSTGSTDYDIISGAFQTTFEGVHDVFVTKINAIGTALLYSTYIGGSSSDVARSIAVDGSGFAYITGRSYSTNYDITSGVFQTTNAGGYDVFVTKLCLTTSTPLITGNTNFCDGDILTFNGSVIEGNVTNYYWEIAESDASGNPVSGGYSWNSWYSGSPSGNFTFPTLPLDCDKFYRIKFAVSNECNPWSETTMVIKINCLPTVSLDDVTLCEGDDFPVILCSGFSKGYSFNWTNNGVTIGTASCLTVYNEGTYCVTVTKNSTGCSSLPVCATVEYDPRLQYNSDFTLEVLNCNSTDPNFNVLATFPLLPTGLTFWWQVCEIDNLGNEISCMTNNSAWWNISTTQDFDPEYTFVKGHIYKITRGIWSVPDDCMPWQASTITDITCNATAKNGVYLSSRDESIMKPTTSSIKNTEFTIYPNPSSGIFTASIERFSAGDLIQVLDYSGKVILEKNIDANKIELNIVEMANGLYFVKVVSANGVSMEKVIKN